MADWSKILTSEAYAVLLASIKGMIYDMARGLDPSSVSASNVPVNAIRWSTANGRWEKFNGSAWAALAATYAISISGNAATVSSGLYTTDIGAKVPSLTGAGASGTWGIGISGNAATASSATSAPWSGITGKPTTVAGYGISDIQSYVFPSGTRLVFAQASAPSGWTQVTDDSANNRMLRVVNSAGNGIGGSHSPVLNNVVPAHTHSFTTGTVSSDHAHGATVGTQSANHTHGAFTYSPGNYSGSGSMGAMAYQNGGTVNTGTESATHTHSVSLGGITSNHTHSGSTDNGSSQTNWTPRYIDLILCSKN